MFVMEVRKNIATIVESEPMTSGSSKVYLIEFKFSPEWDDLSRVAVFRSGETTIDVLLDDSNICFMPWEVLVDHSIPVKFGVYGTRNGDVVLPTIWASTEVILEGVVTGASSKEPSPDIYEQILARLAKLDELEDYINSGSQYEFGHGFNQEGRKISIRMSDNLNPDKTLPISAASVDAMVGNIELLLKTI